MEWNSANLKAENPVLPRVGQEVLLTDGEDVRVGWLEPRADGGRLWYEVGEDEGVGMLDGVTHWMPLPKAPKV